jgi:hypothetical protein
MNRDASLQGKFDALVDAAVSASFEKLAADRQIERPTAGDGPWVVEVKGKPMTSAASRARHSFEIAVLRDGNVHGKRSFGWFGSNKLLISHNGGPCDWGLVPPVWDRMVALAHEVADGLNRAEARSVTPP